MNHIKKSELNKLMMSIADYYKQKINPNFIDLYYQFLKNYPKDDVIRAFKTHTATSKFFPKINELLELIEGNPESKAMQAFSQLAKAVKSLGAYSSIKFTDPVLNKTVLDLGGWTQICQTPDSNWSYLQHRFIKQYTQNLKTQQTYSGHHPGIIEIHNKKFPEFLPKPTLWPPTTTKPLPQKLNPLPPNQQKEA